MSDSNIRVGGSSKFSASQPSQNSEFPLQGEILSQGDKAQNREDDGPVPAPMLGYRSLIQPCIAYIDLNHKTKIRWRHVHLPVERSCWPWFSSSGIHRNYPQSVLKQTMGLCARGFWSWRSVERLSTGILNVWSQRHCHIVLNQANFQYSPKFSRFG